MAAYWVVTMVVEKAEKTADSMVAQKAGQMDAHLVRSKDRAWVVR